MRYIVLALFIITAILAPAIIAAAASIYRAGQQQKADELKRQYGYKPQKHPYLWQQRQILKRAKTRLTYYLLISSKVKGCHACCLYCGYFEDCRDDVSAQKERARREKERKGRK